MSRYAPAKTMNSKISIRNAVLLAILVLSISYPSLAQTTPVQRLTEAMLLEKAGKPAPAIAEVQGVLDLQHLDSLSMAKAWHIQGLAYADQGAFTLSQHAYEESLQVLERLPDNVQDHAIVLDDFGGLYLLAGQFEPADEMKTKALGLYEKIDDHAGIVRASSALATIAFHQKKVTEGYKFLKRAEKESRVANSLDDDDRATIASLQGWLAQSYGDYTVSTARYRQALDLWRELHGEVHPYTGWGHLLLGEADAAAGQLADAQVEIKRSIAILERSLGRQNPRYLSAEMAYARVLDRSGGQSEAAQIRAATEPLVREWYRGQCLGCSFSPEVFH
jgi:tetratricopeptide (TPR) repeat protein